VGFGTPAPHPSCCHRLVITSPTNNTQIFGATDEDVEGLRIISLNPFDLERMESMVAGGSGSSSSSSSESKGSTEGGSSSGSGGGSSSTPDAGSGKP
jgi:uncharacterized membrane protein YgcG